MKCVRRIRDGAIKRVRNEAADAMVKSGDFKYAPKRAWRDQGRA